MTHPPPPRRQACEAVMAVARWSRVVTRIYRERADELRKPPLPRKPPL